MAWSISGAAGPAEESQRPSLGRLRTAARATAAVLAGVVALIGSLTLAQHVLGVDFGIDRPLLFDRSWGGQNVSSPGRMGLPASISWTLLGAAMLGTAVWPRSLRWPAPALALLCLSVAWVGFLGLIYDVNMLYTIPKLTAIAPLTTLFLVAGVVGTLAAMPRRDPARTVLLDRGAAGRVARTAILPLLALAPIIGYLGLACMRAGWYDPAMGVVIMVVALSVVPAALLWRAGRNLSRHEIALRDSEELARRIADIAPVILYIYDLRERRNVWGNRGLTDMLGYTRERIDAIGQDLLAKIMHEDDLPRYAEHAGKLAMLRDEEAVEIEYRMRHADGGWRWLHSRDTVFTRDEAGRVLQILGAASDVTRRRTAEEGAYEAASRLGLALQAAEQGAWSQTSPDGDPEWDARMKEIWGLSADSPVTFQAWLDSVHLDDLPRIKAAVAAACDPVGGGRYHEEYRIRQAGDGQERWVEVVAQVRADGPGSRRVRWFGTAQDVTERRIVQDELQSHRRSLVRLVSERTAELEASHQRLRLAERMAAIGTLSAGLGHDMGNILMPLRVRLETLEALAGSEAATGEIEAIRSLIGYLQRLAGGLRMLAIDPARAAQSGETTELGGWWAEAQTVMRSALPRTIAFEARPASGPVEVAVSRAALTQAVFNLVQNAGDAMRDFEGGRVSVWFEGREGEVLLGVSDTGPGMNEEVRRRCMEPFFTTKTRGLSTGLGLALVYSLVREAGGTVQLDSEPGRGTTFTLRFPAAPGATSRAPMPRHTLVRVGNTRIRAFITAELRHMGHNVSTNNAAEGVRYDLAVVDGQDAAVPSSTVVTVVPGMTLADVRAALRGALGTRDGSDERLAEQLRVAE